MRSFNAKIAKFVILAVLLYASYVYDWKRSTIPYSANALMCKCIIYSSLYKAEGKFTSPNYPTPYHYRMFQSSGQRNNPQAMSYYTIGIASENSNANGNNNNTSTTVNDLCLLYFFLGQSNDLVHIQFEDLDIVDRPNCNNEYIEIFDDETSLVSRDLVTHSLNAHLQNHPRLHEIPNVDATKNTIDKKNVKIKVTHITNNNNTLLCGTLFNNLHQSEFYSRKNSLVFLFYAKGIVPKKRKTSPDIFNSYSKTTGLGPRKYRNRIALPRKKFPNLNNKNLNHSNNRYRGFQGHFKFIDRESMENSQAKLSNGPCVYSFESRNHSSKQGDVFSINFPFSQPSHITYCQYQFHAMENELIHIIVNTTYFGRTDYSCLDAPNQIKIYDGTTDLDPLIGNVCASHNIKYQQTRDYLSSGPQLLLLYYHILIPLSKNSNDKLDVSKRSDDNQNSKDYFESDLLFNRPNDEWRNRKPKSDIGCEGSKYCGYQFSYRFVPITAFHAPLDSTCDKTILSTVSQNGTITSPNYPAPYPGKQQCIYQFVGRGKERIQITFLDFKLFHPQNNPHHCLDVDVVEIATKKNEEESIIEEFCGSTLPPSVMSSGHSLNVDFKAYTSAPKVRGFKFQYSFVKDFGIRTGKQDNSYDCAFEFNSMVNNNGTFTSPNFPGFYPRDTECFYFFYGKPEEKIRIFFLYFDIEGIFPCIGDTESDYIELSNYRSVDRKFPRYCGGTKPPTIVSDNNFFRITFKSNALFDASGFEAHYQFYTPIENKIQYNYQNFGRKSSIPQTHLTYLILIIFLNYLYG